jgi:hypothetical protein
MIDIPQIGGITVSKMISKEGKDILFMFRGLEINEMDSGWVLFSAYENDEYANNPDNYEIYSLESVLKFDSDILNNFLNPVGAVFERKSKTHSWEIVYDYPLEDDIISEKTLSDNWKIIISNLFHRRDDQNGDIIFVAFQRTVRIHIWQFPGKSKEELFEEEKERLQNRDKSFEPIIEVLESSSENVSRLAYITQESDENKSYKVLYNFNIKDDEIVQSAIYYDTDLYKNWAIETWNSIK